MTNLYDQATCYKCGSNAWTSCQHREALREAPAESDYKDRKEKMKEVTGGGRYAIRPSAMTGLNFKTRARK